MFFQESEILVRNEPELEDIIARVDDLIHSIGSSGLFDPIMISKKLNERPSQIKGILIELVKNGLIKEDRYIECPYCYNLMNIISYGQLINKTEFECTQCEADLSEQVLKTCSRFKLNKEAQAMQKSTTTGFSNGLSKKLPSYLYNNCFMNTHLLRYYSREPKLQERRPFNGKKFLVLLHFLADLVPFIEAAKILGLDLSNSCFFYKDYPYPQKEAIIKWLKDNGARVEPRSFIKQYLEELAKTPEDDIGTILIIEDGGFISPLIHSDFPNLVSHTIGSVEQTTRGIRNADKIPKLEFPIISVAKSRLKGDFEPHYVAKAALNNINKLLPNLAINGKEVAIYGYGSIGKELAKKLKESNAIVTIYDISQDNRLLAMQTGLKIADSPSDAAKNKTFIFGASGEETIDSDVFSAVSHGTYLASISSELYEIDMEELSRQKMSEEVLINELDEIIGTRFYLPPNNKVINILANGYPINFWGFESMPEEASDLILSLILLSAAELAMGNHSDRMINSQAVNEISEKYEISKKFLEFHKQG